MAMQTISEMDDFLLTQQQMVVLQTFNASVAI
jgi:hypothetical protein